MRTRSRLALLTTTLSAVVVLSSHPVRAADLENGDWLVGGFTAVWRIRAGTPSVFCQDTDWRNAFSMLVDSQDRVAFLAEVVPGTLFPTGVGGFGLFRCPVLGGATELLALFPVTAFDPMDITGPLPYPMDIMAPLYASADDGALHLAKRASVVIDDAVNGGVPTIATEDVYVMGLAVLSGAGGPRNEVRVVEYRPSDATWRAGPEVVTSVDNLNVPDFRVPDMVNSAGDTISGATFKVAGRSSEAIETALDGQIGGMPFSLALTLFGGLREVPHPDPVVFGPRGPFLNDLAVTGPRPCNVPGSPYSTESPKEFSGAYVFYEGPVGLAMKGANPVFAFNNVFSPRFAEIANFRTMLRDPGNPGNYFQYEFTGCGPQPWFKIHRTDPLIPSNSYGIVEMATGGSGNLAAIAGGKVFRVENNDPLIAENFDGTSLESIAGYPPPVSTSLLPTVIVRVDSPLEVLVTTAQGRKLGLEAGLPVNDLDNRGYDSGTPAPGEPRIYAIHADEYEPVSVVCPVPYTVDAVATLAGSYTYHVYTLDLANGLAKHLVTNGSVGLGQNLNLSFSVAADGTVFLDRDGDGLSNAVETNTGVFVGPGDTGTDPDVFDSDGDGIGDGLEVANGTDPTDPNDPSVVNLPATNGVGAAVLAAALLATGVALRRRRASAR